MYDLLIKNGQVFDGSGAPAQNTDIGVKDGKIVELGDMKNEKAMAEINAEGRFVCPGFIDIGNEADHYLDVFSSSGAENLIRQGVTTIIGGNSGASLAPLISGSLAFMKKWGDPNRLNVNWRELKDLFQVLDQKKIAVNFATLIGWGSLRTEFTKGEFRNLKKEELEKLKLLVKQGMEQGALGVSFGLGFAAEQAVGKNEVMAVGETVRRQGGYLGFSLRNQSEDFLVSVQEILDIADAVQTPVEISDFYAEGKPNFDNFTQALKAIKKFNQKAELVDFDLCPYDSNAKVLYSVLPEWAAVGGREVLLRNIADETIRKKIIQDLKRKKYLYQDILIADSGQRWWFSGKTLAEIAHGFGLSLEESLLKVVQICEDRVIVFTENLLGENVQEGLRSPYALVSSHSGFGDTEMGLRGIWVHPRSFGAFPRFLGHYIRQEKLFSWEAGIHKITGQAAAQAGLASRGLLQKGCWADVVIFHPERINDHATLKNPFQYPEGIETVIINGGLVYHKGILTEEKYGQTLRRAAQNNRKK